MKSNQKKDNCIFDAPILVKVSLKRHSPEEIYDYIQRNIGDLGMKIKKRQAIIGFENQKFYQKLINQHQNIMLHGKKLQFKLMPKADENQIMSQQEEMKEMAMLGDKKFGSSQSKTTNTAEQRVHFYRSKMLQNVNNLFEPTLDSIRLRTQQLKIQYKQKAPFVRQMISFQKVLQKKLQKVQQKYEMEIKNMQKYIQSFSQKPTTIDLEPSFNIEQTWQFPQINSNNMNFQADSYFKNNSSYLCKRLCAINGEQFAVTMCNRNKQGQFQGMTKLYNLNQSDEKKSILIDGGAYGICRVNNFLFMGSYDSKIKYVNLEDNDYQLNSSITLNQLNPHATYMQLKLLKQLDNNYQILTLERNETGNKMKIFNLTFDQIMPGLLSASLSLTYQLNQEHCITLQVLNSQEILYGLKDKVRKCHLQKKSCRDIITKSGCIKMKKFNENLIAVASTKTIQIADLRSEQVVQTFTHMPRQLRSMQIIGEHSLMYGAYKQIGLLDDRKPDIFPWKCDDQHQDIVYDILKLKNRIVSCDALGGIYSWKLNQTSSSTKHS